MCSQHAMQGREGGGIRKVIKETPHCARSRKTYGAFAPSWEVSFLFASHSSLEGDRENS